MSVLIRKVWSLFLKDRSLLSKDRSLLLKDRSLLLKDRSFFGGGGSFIYGAETSPVWRSEIVAIIGNYLSKAPL